MGWEEALSAAVKNNATAEWIRVLSKELDTLTGTPKQALKHKAVQYIEAALNFNSSALYRLSEELTGTGEAIAEELAVFLLSAHYSAAPEGASKLLRKLACSPFPDVREWTASACGTVLCKQFESFYPTLAHWSKDANPMVRQAVAVALKFASNAKNPAWGPLLLDLLEPLMRDKASMVKKEIGGRALGDAMLRNYIDDLELRLKQWMISDQPLVRWHCAKLFTAPEAANRLDRLGWALQSLLRDESATVHKAAISALGQLGKRVQDPSLLLKLSAAV
ncbi:DNA alkylation repair protein [Paenibacillus cremeus]|uniref:HEAT repeat domain-containing protein n=1 Tax=Paenibacillus cremeus TaxID=2163881 RepID=A0A559KAH0_9BACL|nr:DNA alkylation repair protein [Paenibacillus cremeus]TVY09127.1 hypothetical protein FPZ49_15600 [Paenibacillus cremeus]